MKLAPVLQTLSVDTLLNAAIDPDTDEAALRYLQPLRAQATELGSTIIRLPFSRVAHGSANHRCLVCRADRWTPSEAACSMSRHGLFRIALVARSGSSGDGETGPWSTCVTR